MACGTPVVASRTGGLKYTIKDGKTGYLVKPRDSIELAEKIILILNNGKDFYKHNCIRRIDSKFNWINISNKYKKYFNKLIKEK
jgi:glycosyltransferase involved in cell wall biosynthesis